MEHDEIHLLSRGGFLRVSVCIVFRAFAGVRVTRKTPRCERREWGRPVKVMIRMMMCWRPRQNSEVAVVDGDDRRRVCRFCFRPFPKITNLLESALTDWSDYGQSIDTTTTVGPTVVRVAKLLLFCDNNNERRRRNRPSVRRTSTSGPASPPCSRDNMID
jgi:hypothetical protein